MLLEVPIENAKQSSTLTLIAVYRGLNLLGEITEENIGLAHHRSHTTDLEHQPLDDAGSAPGVIGHQAPGFFSQIQENRARFKDREILFGAIDDRRDSPVRVDRQKPGLLLLTL